MRRIDADELIYEIVNTSLAEGFPYDKEWFDRLQSVIHKIIDMVENAPSVGWISVKERLPEKDEEVIVCVQMENGMLYVTGAELWDDGLFWTDSGPLNSPRYKVTHWMPLPEPPEVEE